MRIYKSMSPINVIKPFEMPLSCKKIYSFEGLCLYLTKDWFESVLALESKELFDFIKQQLELKNLHDDIEEIYTKTGKVSPLFDLMLEALPVKFSQQEAVMTKLESWDCLGPYDQLKKKGDTFYGVKQYAKALSYYNQGKGIKETVEVENNIGLVYLMLREYNMAIEYFERAIAIEPKSEIYHNLIQVYKQQGRLDEALDLIYKIVEAHESALLLYEAGDINLMKRRFNPALMNFSKSYEMEPKPEVIYRMIETRIEARQLKQAMTQLEHIKVQDLPKYYLMKAAIYEKAKHYDVAIETLEEAVEICGEKRSFYMKLARLYRENKQIIKAIEAVNKVMESTVTDDELVYEMALIAKQAGRYPDYYDKINQLIQVWKKEARYRLAF